MNRCYNADHLVHRPKPAVARARQAQLTDLPGLRFQALVGIDADNRQCGVSPIGKTYRFTLQQPLAQ